MTTFAWTIAATFGVLFVFFLVALHLILVPGVLLFLIVYDSVKPRRGLAVTGSGIVEFRVGGLNADPKEALTMTGHAALFQGSARNVGGKVAIPFGSETVLVRERDYATLLPAVSAAPGPPLPRQMFDDLPRWRRGSIGWVLAHFFAACAAMLVVIAIAQLVAMWFHRDPNRTSSGGDAFLWLVFAMLLTGWYLFVYLPHSFRTRITVLLALAGGAVVVACIVNTVFSPALPN